MFGQVVRHIAGLFRAGRIVQTQLTEFDADVADSTRVGRIGWGLRSHRGLLVSGTIRPASISTCRAAALRAQCFARQAM